ncbi:MAG: metallophosphoesterase [Anaerolineae bacterium]|nr:metallophosphoesterase [Anaerolineae bacterium]
MSTIFVLGDIHGCLDKITPLLYRAGLVDRRLAWTGGDATLCLLGDYVDRGLDSIPVLDLIMRLQREAAGAGGRVLALLGNHDLMLSIVSKVPDALAGTKRPFRQQWTLNGGIEKDLERLRPEHVAWIDTLPSMMLVAGRLLIHADATFYRDYGASVDEVNASITAVIQGGDPAALALLDERFAQRMAFRNGASAIEAASRMLQTYGGQQILHGHTPISKAQGGPPAEVTSALRYANGLCVNCDSGMYLGGPGFLHVLPDDAPLA